MNEHLELCIDSDGVLAHFEGRIADHVGLPFHKISRGAMWRAVEDYDRKVGPFFESLEKMPDADELMDFCIPNFVNLKIVTATGQTPRNAAAQKRNWYKRTWPGVIVKCVQSSSDKARLYAHPLAILVDDRAKSIDPWVEAGGIGILHTSAANTIARLREIINETAGR